LLKSKDQQTLKPFMEEAMKSNGSGTDALLGPGGFYSIRSYNQYVGRLSKYDEQRAQKVSSREPMPFHGDGDADDEGSHPPKAWTVIWNEVYNKCYGSYIKTEIKLWGLIMWVRRRIPYPRCVV
jgi:hypothetical protein